MSIQTRKKPASAPTLILAFNSLLLTTPTTKGGRDHEQE